MQVGRQEYSHHSREQIVGYLRDAAEIVDELDLDGPLRLSAFVKAVDLLAAKQIVFEQVQMGIRGAIVPPGH